MIADRLRRLGISEERISALALGRDTAKPTPAALASLAARLVEPAVQADLEAFREYNEERDPWRRARMRVENGPSIDRGADVYQELPEPQVAAVKA